MIRNALIGSSLLLLAPVSALAQEAAPLSPGRDMDAPLANGETGSSGAVAHSPAPSAGGSTPAAAAPAIGDAILARLNALEAKVAALEARNRELEAQASATKGGVEQAKAPPAMAVQSGPAPTFADAAGTFTFKPRGFLQLDYAAFNRRAGGYNFDSGTDIRRGRFGFEGTAYRDFKWRIEAELVKNNVNLLDAYVQYAGVPHWALTVGQHKAPFGLEANSSDAFNTFLERGMFINAFGAVGAERRVGLSAAYQSDHLNAQVGLFGASEAVQRNPVTPDEVHSVNGRVTWDPVLGKGRVVHVGASAFHANSLAGKAIVLGDRPETRVDNSLLEAVAIGPVTTGPEELRTRGVRDVTFVGGEAAGVYGPFSLQGEYGHLAVDRYDAVPTLYFDGFYAFATFFLTGESRLFRNGVVDRIKPFENFDPAAGHWGAFELVGRYDRLDLSDHDLSDLPHVATTYTGGLNWYLNPNTRVVFNYIHFKGINSPLVVAPVITYGTTAKGDVYASRLQFDF